MDYKPTEIMAEIKAAHKLKGTKQVGCDNYL
jgi:hypothetical protein